MQNDIIPFPAMNRISSLLLLLASLCSLGLSSCVSTDIPFALDSIGREYAVIARKNYKPRQMPEIYRLGDSYYMKLDVKYMPTEFGLFTWNSLYNSESVFTFNKWTQQLYDSAPVEPHMVLLSDNGKKELLGIDAEAVTPTAPKMIPVAVFDFTHATRCTPKPLTGIDPRSMLSSYGYLELEPRCSTLNMALKPLSWASWAVEIPFVIATNTVIWSVALPTSQIMAAAQQQQSPAQDEDNEEE
jgi:hypothetical protein